MAVGEVYPVTQSASFSGNYGISMSQNDFGFLPPESDGVGEIKVGGMNLSGTMDINLASSPLIAETVTGSFQAGKDRCSLQRAPSAQPL